MLTPTPIARSGTIASGQVGWPHLASGAVRSGHISATGTPNGTLFLRDDFSWATAGGGLASGNVGSGFLASGSVQGFFGTTRDIASGTVGVFDFGSGAVVAGTVGSGAIVSGNIASGQIGSFHIADNAIRSGDIGSGAVTGQAGGGNFVIASGTVTTNDIGSGAIVSGLVASGQLGAYHHASGFLTSGSWIGSGSIWGRAGPNQFMIASGTITTNDLGSGAIVSGLIASGQVGNFHISSGAVTSGRIGATGTPNGTLFLRDDFSWATAGGGLSSGSVGSGNLASGSVQGFFGTTRDIASGTVGVFDFGSGAVIAGTVGSGAIQSGNIASGQIGSFHIADNAVQSGDVGSGAVTGQAGGGNFVIASGTIGTFDIGSGAIQSGRIASGQLGTYHFASGTTDWRSQYSVLIVSGISPITVITEEAVSGVRAVSLSLSGNIRVAMASVAARMPAIGVVLENVASGIQANVYTAGLLQVTSGLADYSGYLGQPLYVGRSGQLVTVSGSFNSGGLASGDTTQQIGIVLNSGAVAVGAEAPFVSGGPFLGSGAAGSGSIASGSVQGFFGTVRNIASGTVGVFDFGSGAVITGAVGSGAIQSGNVASGAIGSFHIADTAVRSGDLGSGAVTGQAGGGYFVIASGTITTNDIGSGAIVSGLIASGQIGSFHIADTAIRSGDLGSGAVTGQAGGGYFVVASGTITTNDIGSGAIVSGLIASGQVGNFAISSGAVTSGRIGATGTPNGTLFLRDDFSWAAAGGGLSSGSVGSGFLASGSVQGFFGTTRDIASGTVGVFDFGSGAVVAGTVGSGAIQSGNVASGQINTYHLGSGTTATNAFYVGAYISGTVVNNLTEEIISGVRAVCISQSGNIRVAMASVSGRMPAIGIVKENVASGIQANVWAFAADNPGGGGFGSGLVDFSGYLGQPVYVGRSGQIVTASGSFNSGGFVAGDYIQTIGIATNSGDACIAVQPSVYNGSVVTFLPSIADVVVTINSGAIQSGNVASGSVQGFFGTTRNIASGTVGVFDFGSGAVITGTVGSGAIQSGNIASGAVGSFHLASAILTSGSWIGSGAIWGQAGVNQFMIASGTIGTFDIGSGAIVSGRVASGQIGHNHIAANTIQSGQVASGAVTGQAGGGNFSIASGTITTNDIGSGAIVSGLFASGQLGSYHGASGVCIDRSQYVLQYVSGINRGPAIITEEIVSGVRAVALSQSGNVRVAMASVSGRMPAIGVVVDNVASGIQANVYTIGDFQLSSGMADYSGYLGQLLYVGRSGQIVTASGSFNSGGLLSGDISQPIGTAANSGSPAVAVATQLPFVAGQLNSGNIASGQLGTYHLASGTMSDWSQYNMVMTSGVMHITCITEEAISGVKAVAVSQSGHLRVAMASVSGRMPAVGVVVDNVASGIQTNVYVGGMLQFTSGLADYSGRLGLPVYVGRSGQVVAMSGAFGSGGFASGDYGQRLGVVLNSGAVAFNVCSQVFSGGPTAAGGTGGMV